MKMPQQAQPVIRFEMSSQRLLFSKGVQSSAAKGQCYSEVDCTGNMTKTKMGACKGKSWRSKSNTACTNL